MRTTQVSVFHVLFENVTRLNPVYDGGTGGGLCRLWEHQGSWEREIFRELLKFNKVFGLIFVSKTLYLGGSGSFVRTISKIWKMVCTLSMSKFSIYWLFTVFFFCFKYNNEWLRINKLHKCKQMIFCIHSFISISQKHVIKGPYNFINWISHSLS